MLTVVSMSSAETSDCAIEIAAINNNNDVKLISEQDVDQEDWVNFLAATVFGIPLIFQEILVNLEVQDLLKCSLVNKFWLEESRKVLREKRECVIQMGKQETCGKLKQLSDLLSLTDNPLPFNGIQLSPFCYACVKRNISPGETPKPSSFENIFSKIKIEHLVIMNPNNSCRLSSGQGFIRVMRVLLPSSPHCLAEQFLRRLFTEYSNNLKSLAISYPLNSSEDRFGIYPNILSELIGDQLQQSFNSLQLQQQNFNSLHSQRDNSNQFHEQNYSNPRQQIRTNFHQQSLEVSLYQNYQHQQFFKNLRTLKLLQGPFPPYVSHKVVTNFLGKCPNLRNMHGYVSPALLDCLLVSKSTHLISEFVFSPDPSFAQQYLHLADSGPKIRSFIAARKMKWASEDMKFMTNVLKTVLLSNKNSLESLSVDQSVLSLLVTLDVPLGHVTHLRVGYDEADPNFQPENYQPELEVYVPFHTIDLAKIFPKLLKLELHLHFKSRYAAASAFHMTDLQGPILSCGSVNELRVNFLGSTKGISVQKSCFQSVMAMLPNIKILQVDKPESFGNLLELLWQSSWKDLEQFRCRVHASQCAQNLDDVFLGGIHNKFNIFKLPNFKEFALTFFHSKQVCQAVGFPETVFLSQRAFKSIVEKCPDLVFVIQQFWDNYSWNDLPCNLSMQHLKIFDNVIFSTMTSSPSCNDFSFTEYECGPPKVYNRVRNQ